MKPTRESSSVEAKILLQQLETAFNQLKKTYDLFFIGQVKLEPQADRKHVEQLLRRCLDMRFNNTGDKYKLGSLTQQWNTFKNQWDKILLQIERGTYKRDLTLAKLHGYDTAKPGAAPPPPAASAAKKPAAEASDPVKALFDTYVQAKRSVNESVAGMTLEAFRSSLSKQQSKLKESYGDRKFEFKVVVEDGKAKLKATQGK